MYNTINFTQHILKKDLEAYSTALFELTQKLMIENQELKEKLKHLEDLLVSSTNIPEIKPDTLLNIEPQYDKSFTKNYTSNKFYSKIE